MGVPQNLDLLSLLYTRKLIVPNAKLAEAPSDHTSIYPYTSRYSGVLDDVRLTKRIAANG